MAGCCGTKPLYCPVNKYINRGCWHPLNVAQLELVNRRSAILIQWSRTLVLGYCYHIFCQMQIIQQSLPQRLSHNVFTYCQTVGHPVFLCGSLFLFPVTGSKKEERQSKEGKQFIKSWVHRLRRQLGVYSPVFLQNLKSANIQNISKYHKKGCKLGGRKVGIMIKLPRISKEQTMMRMWLWCHSNLCQHCHCKLFSSSLVGF